MVTFPVPGPAAGREVAVGDVTGRIITTLLSWPAGGAHARVRGDLGQAGLVNIATATRIVAGRPLIDAPVGYTVVSQGPYRPPHIREARYNGVQLTGVLPGLVSTGVTDVAGLEDSLYTRPVTGCGVVHGQSAVVTPTFGGNGAVAWQPTPGQVAFVGYSGNELTGPVLAALYRLAEQSRTIDDRQWRTTNPLPVNQPNNPMSP